MSLDDLTAAGSAVATEPITGAGDGTGGGAEAVPETLPVESPETQPTEAPTEPSQQPTQPEPEPVPEGQPVPLPKELRALMADKELSANPIVSAALKQLQSAYDRLNAYTLHFPTVGDAKKFAEAFPGGIQDAIEAQNRAQQAIDGDNIYYSRDPKQHFELASTWFDDDPEAFPVLAQAGLEVLAEKSPDAYRQIGLTVLEQTLGAMMDAASRRNDQESLTRISKVHEDIFGRKPGEQPRQDPRDAHLTARERAIAEREQHFQAGVATNFANESNTLASNRISQAIGSIVDRALAQVKITPGAKEKIKQDTYDEINALLKQDKSLDTQLQSFIRNWARSGFDKAKQERWVNAIYAKARGLVQSTAQKVINQWTTDFLGIKKADSTKRESAAARTDISGGGSPNLGVTPLTGEQLYNMSDEEIAKLPPNFPKSPNWREEMRRARLKSQAA